MSWLRTQWSKPHGPLWLTVLLFVAAVAFIRPWGDFALNDDWTFAHFAKHFAEQGFIKLDAPSSPNAVGQALVGGLLIRVFGFSHVVLRVLSMVVGLAGLWALNSMLLRARISNTWRLASLLVLAFNPIYFYASTTFHTEIHGWVPPLIGAAVWFYGREKAQGTPRLVPFWVACVVALLTASSFWTRQICVLVFPALVGTSVARALFAKESARVVRTLPALAVAGAIFGAVIAAYFPWARATGNFRPEFAERIGHLSAIRLGDHHMQWGAALFYMTMYFAPFLLVLRWRTRPGANVAAVLLLVLGLTARAAFQHTAPSDFFIGPIWTHKIFPFVVNIVWNAGLGPMTFDDTFFADVPKPSWRKEVWSVIEAVLIVMLVRWALVGQRLVRHVKQRFPAEHLEVPLFGALLGVGGMFAIVQVHQLEMVDRYHLPVILGLSLAVPSVVGAEKLTRSLGLRFAVPLALVAAFTVLGAHDQFRWNEARWALYEKARTLGATRATFQGGYEMNCWWRHEGLRSDELTCGAACGCARAGFCCVDDHWRVGLSVFPGYTRVDSIQPGYLLAPGPPVVLSRRD